ncbi:flagellar assembly protein FliH [Aestuariirhabdus sp. Z084]|uniref:flagellar assembly protein FliH n=1 Tax=Aestuariirhabdus haliotis TaxID=2918751 RepID=UPI00201B3691|nr:flagellar assembly protein FliH [Aestuariirhabdus haliotis]MCL6414463.1 flagellar assembly protein FliH [Aestuariirhabdus haliotis]MCL6418555.1 flagellar assembly protein FliH [Aestuariirhabdus haliotis]
MTAKTNPFGSLIPAEKMAGVKTVVLPAFQASSHVVEREGVEEDRAGFRRKPKAQKHPDMAVTPEQPAQTQAQQLKVAREEAYVEGFAEGKQAGYDEGFSLGKRDGEKQGESIGIERAEREASQRFDAQLKRQGDMIAELSRQLVHPIIDQDEAITRALAELSLSIAKEVIGRELMLDSSQIENLCREAIKQLPLDTDTIRVHINPHDQAVVQKLCDELQGDWQILPDASLSPGGCRIETNDSLIDISIEKKVEMIAQQVAEQHLHTHGQIAQQQQQSLAEVEQHIELSQAELDEELASEPQTQPVESQDSMTASTEDALSDEVVASKSGASNVEVDKTGSEALVPPSSSPPDENSQ